jgi:predicted membrane channel-forming protein YqfA (hemolysin III family)
MAIPLFWRLAIAIIVVSYAWNNWPFPPRARLDEIGRFVELSYVFLVGVLAYTLIFEPRGFLITTPIMAIYLCGILFYSVATPLVLAFAPIFAIVAVFWPERWKWKRRPKR